MSLPYCLLELDSARPVLVESSFTHTRRSSDVPIDNGANSRVYKWGTGSITLKPVNLTTDFTQTANYEALKFRLGDGVIPIKNPAQTHTVLTQKQGTPWFAEVPMNTNGAGPSDYFFNCVVSKVNVPYQPIGGFVDPLINMLAAVSAQTLATAQNFQQQTGVYSMVSAEKFPSNQGYQIRFYHQIVSGQKRSGVYQFVFGDFCVFVNTDGTADIYQTADYQSWRLWESFTYGVETGYENEYSITIFPHGKNKIEFISKGDHSSVVGTGARPGTGAARVQGPELPPTRHIFTCPWDTTDATNLNGYTITKPGQWYMVVSQEFRPRFQVSLLGFDSGTQANAEFFDSLQSIGFVPTIMPTQRCVYDLNGGSFTSYLMTLDFPNLVSGSARPFLPGGTGNTGDEFYSLYGVFQGARDVVTGVAGVDNLSTFSPEFYAYTVDKPGVFRNSPLSPVTVPVMHIDIDTGSSLENKHLQVTIDNSSGQLDDYKYRGNVPCRLLDPYYNIVLFEGTWYDPESFESSAELPHVRASVRSRADDMLRSYPANLDFTIGNDNGNPWSWQGVLRRCAEVSGIIPTNVVFENVGLIPGSSFDFPLWNAIDSGGASTIGKSDGEQDVARWRPKSDTPIYQFFDTLCRNIMGWHFEWNSSDSTLRIYKRPQPNQVAFAQAKCAFFSTESGLIAWQNANSNSTIACYLHSGMSFTTKRPNFTTLVCQGYFPIRKLQTVAQVLLAGQQPNTQIQDSVYTTQNEFVSEEYNNPNGYVRSDGTYTIGPDFLGSKKARPLNLTSAGSIEAFRWISRRAFEDQCFGHRYAHFESEWGDPYNYNLRKWDLILIDPSPIDNTTGWWQMERVEPQWGAGSPRRGRYTASEYRADAPPPR